MPKLMSIPIYKTAPFIRLLIPLVVGILLEWHFQIEIKFITAAIISFSFAIGLFYFLPLAFKFKLQVFQGILIHLLLISFGLFVTWQKDSRHQKNWYGNNYSDSGYLVAVIGEPIVEKPKTFKAESNVVAVLKNDSVITCEGKLLVYFSKDSFPQKLQYGDKILIHKPIQEIKNSGNPGAFNYRKYSEYKQIFHNIFLKEKDWVLLPDKEINQFQKFIFNSREKILSILKTYISKDQLGIAEALLIGYTMDLDKDLMQAYSNTGVIHIIAISGMHLGLIYWMLTWIFARMPGLKKSKILQTVLVLICLWLFSFLTGAAASIIRSAVMFSFIAVGKVFTRKTTVYNSIGASAFFMLCYNPYYLWEVGFQLSYLAIISIVSLQRPIYNLCYVKNKCGDWVWKLASVALAAQILVFPICIFYFHQFPNLFLFANIILVPLSEVILIGEILLIALNWLPHVGFWLGKICNALVWLMNKIILIINDLPYSFTDNLSANILSTILMYILVISLCVWLVHKNKSFLWLSLTSILAFVMYQSFDKWQVKNQQKIIVYNVPQHQAIDFVSSNKFQFFGDSILMQEGMLQNFHLKPGRIAMQLKRKPEFIPNFSQYGQFIQFNNKNILIVDKPIQIEPIPEKLPLDLILISKNPNISIGALSQIFNCNQYIADGSNSLWKIGKWKKDCEALHLQLHSVPEEGAFVMKL